MFSHSSKFSNHQLKWEVFDEYISYHHLFVLEKGALKGVLNNENSLIISSPSCCSCVTFCLLWKQVLSIMKLSEVQSKTGCQ